MKEQKSIRKKLIKSLFFYLILLLILYTTFSLFILKQFSIYIYKPVDRELEHYKNKFEEIPDITVNSDNSEISKDELINKAKDKVEKIANPRIITILRDNNGNVIATSIKYKYFSDYIKTGEFSPKNVNTIYEIEVNSKYYYRATTYEWNISNGEKYFIDILVNINSEKEIMDNFSKTLLISTGIVVIISIILSWFLAKKSIEPFVTAYEKQTEFVQNASHELRTPLTIIQAKQELLLQYPQSKIIDKSEDIVLSLNETRRLSKMVKELMDLARVDNKKKKLNKEMTNMNELIKETIPPYKELAELQNKKMNIQINCESYQNVDKNKIKQLLVILLDNALKYTEEKDEISINIYTHDEKLFIIIKDTGIGISDEGLKHIFERFYREDKARSREKGGTGLGLSIAHTIVVNHGGSIKIAHNKPKGTIVTIKI